MANGQREGEANWAEGTLLKFTKPLNEWEQNGQYMVVEMRGPRVLVIDTRHIGKFNIVPQDVFDTCELEPI